MKTPTQSSSSQALDTITVAKRHMPFAWSPLTTRKLLLFGCVLTLLFGCATSLPVAYQSPDASARRLRFVGMWSGLEHFGSGSHQTSFGTVYHLSADGTGYRKSKFFGRNYANNDFWGGEYTLDSKQNLVWRLTGPDSISILFTSLERSNGPKYQVQFSKGPFGYSFRVDGGLQDSVGVIFTKATDGNETDALAKIAYAAYVQHTQQMANGVADPNDVPSLASGLLGFARAATIGAATFSSAVQTNNPMGAVAAAADDALGNGSVPAAVANSLANASGRKTYNIQANRPVAPAFVPGTQNNGTYQDDAGCKSCLTNPAFLTWKQRCNDQTTAQSASHCAAAVLDRCMIDHGGCGQTIAALQSAMEADNSAAAALGTRCFLN